MRLQERALILKVEDRMYLALPTKLDYERAMSVAIVELDLRLLELIGRALKEIGQTERNKEFESFSVPHEAVNFYEVDIQKEVEFWTCFVTENPEFDGRFEMNKKEWQEFNKAYLTGEIFSKYWTLSVTDTITLSGELEIPVLHKTIQFCTREVSTEQLLNVLRRQQ